MPTLPLRVLVLEDHPLQRSVALTMLQQLGCQEVFVAADGAQALAILERVGPVDIALCDLRMEGMDGLEFLRSVGPSGLVGSIIISSSLSADLRRAVQQLVALSGLVMLGDVGKPLQPDALQQLLTKHLTEPQSALPLLSVTVLASEEEVRHAIDDQQLRAYFQPKFDLRTGRVQSVEVLARWQHPTKGVLPPSVFLPVMEQCGLMDELLFLQLHQGLSLQRQAWELGYRLNLAFNLHATQLANPQLTSRIKTILTAHGTPGPSLTFELTESGLLETPATALETLVRLRMMGCQLSIDDFGAGFSSLQRLCQLPFNEIKLDAEFVRTLKHEPRCRAAISSTLALGEALGMTVVIEGIETEEQRQELVALGCTQGQGYLCARPMSGGDLLSWLDVRRVSDSGVFQEGY
jgi:EAL domain-containing protein (putative c-di-GMP-specific phosphodiesterase class I)/CheY-like chemotaxis protein